MSNGVLNPTPSDGQVASEGVFASNRAVFDELGFGKREQFQVIIDLARKADKDHTRLEAAKYACKVCGHEPTEKTQVEHSGYIQILSPADVQKPEDAGRGEQ